MFSSWQIKWLHSKPTCNYGTMSEHWHFWHVLKISRDFERDWARPFFPPAETWSFTSAFQRLSITSQAPKKKKKKKKKPLNWEGMDLRLFANKQDESTLSTLEEIQLLRSQMIVVLKVCLRKLQISIWSGLKSWWNILRLLQKHWKVCFCFQHPIFVKDFYVVRATKMRLESRLDISNALSMGPFSCRNTNSGLSLVLH